MSKSGARHIKRGSHRQVSLANYASLKIYIIEMELKQAWRRAARQKSLDTGQSSLFFPYLMCPSYQLLWILTGKSEDKDKYLRHESPLAWIEAQRKACRAAYGD